ncbi:MAG: two-component system response regulator [Oceanicaulis sp.]|jgi:CheY-like chemotaxis protein|uniref:Response regulator n=1 Tax=Maricaulis virginensis TaxID=144022 RepID=A0A9W6MME5_9PROT|nr:response regulator [Maricaulis virginensis]MAC38856.1 two-component system response regulator [Oceanicaulis sp.]GLK50729.1 response regulator [Maricaulis virginensis]
MAADFSRVRTLIVDDNTYMLTILRTILHGFGIKQIYESRDPAEAFDMVRSDSIDIIITDYQMDILDGLDFVRLVRTADDSPNPLVPIIMLSAYSERSKVMAARDAGVTEFCCKPITAKEMFSKIAAVINEPRPFIRNRHYFGPDRRRNDPDKSTYKGPERRKSRQKAAAKDEGGENEATKPAQTGS